MHKRKVLIISIINLMVLSVLIVDAQNDYLYASWSDEDVSLTSEYANWTDALGHSLSKIQTELFLKNTRDYFYIGIFHYSGLNVINVSIILDTNHDLLIADDVKSITNTGILKDYYFPNENLLIADADSQANFNAKFDNSFNLGATTGIFVEFKIPLIPPVSELLTDLVVIDPSDFLVGCDVAFGLNNGSNFSYSQGLTNNYVGDASNFLTVVLAPPGRFKTPDFAPPSSIVTSTETSTKSSSTTEEGGLPGGASSPGFTGLDSLLILILSTGIIIPIKRRMNK